MIIFNLVIPEERTDKQSGEIYIETTPEDIAEANALMKAVLLRKSDQLSGACRNYFERLKQHLNESKETSFTNRQISLALDSLGRSGVPVYALYPPGEGAPILLPELLTEQIVLDAIDQVAGPLRTAAKPEAFDALANQEK